MRRGPRGSGTSGRRSEHNEGNGREPRRPNRVAGTAVCCRTGAPRRSTTGGGEMAKSSSAVPTRPFGRSKIPVSIMALGGWHLGLPKTEREATRLVHAAIDGGITFMDNAWDYNAGVSETRMGKALAGRRDKVFLMTKACVHGRDARTAMKQLEE